MKTPETSASTSRDHFDVIILGAGMAGLTLARHLLLETDQQVLMIERRESLPPARQKVGESTVQLAGYYLAKVLDLEEHLLSRHYLKNNLRFYWKNAGGDRGSFEGYSQSLIRTISNVASYQLDRNVFEAELLRLNREDPRFEIALGIRDLEVELDGGGAYGATPHRVTFGAGDEARTVTARWVVDATGRGRILSRRQRLDKRNAIRHGSFFWWVDGLVDVEKLTDRSRRQGRLDRRRRITGHLPAWLATNHFVGEGFWFWVIPLHGKTSLGLVYDVDRVAHGEVFSVDKATEWICREFPLFARDLPGRKVLDFAGFRDFSYDCAQTLSASRWALTGEAGRFSDPLYSPGSDLIAIHNTLIVDAVLTDDEAELARKCQLGEQLMRSVYSAYVPSYATSYDVLGAQETFVLKYAWELGIYFAFYVFPFLNDLLTDRRFALSFLRAFARLGPTNRGVQQLLAGYYHWRKDHVEPDPEPRDFDFTELTPLSRALQTFYEVGVTVEEARRVLAEQLASAEELARYVAAHIASVVVDDPRALVDRRFVEGFDLDDLHFDPDAMRARWKECAGDGAGAGETYPWSFDPRVLDRLRPARLSREPEGDLAVQAMEVAT
jgi:flavin-dependent dehydrogenase